MQNEIQEGRLNSILHKLLNMAEGSPSPTLATDVFPMLALEVDRPEWHFLGGERLGWARWYLGGTAAQYSHVGVRNPAGSGVLVVVERIVVSVAAGNPVQLGLRSVAAVDVVSSGLSRDTRFAQTGGFSTTGQYVAVTSTGGSVLAYPSWDIVSPGGEPLYLTLPVVLSPGYELLVWPNALNAGITACFAWRERALEPSETR